jgi:SAM-dependent methyltransferase
MHAPIFDWNERWREKVGLPLEPDPWLVKILPLLPATGQVLDLACGNGRNALFLAEKGFSVTALDYSGEGLEQLGREAARRRLAVATRRVDLECEPTLPVAACDLVIDFFYLHRPLLPQLRQAVRPGGMAVLRTFSSAGPFPGGPENPAFILAPGELLDLFAGWEILLHEEGLEPSKKGGALAGIVARKPRESDRRGDRPCAR